MLNFFLKFVINLFDFKSCTHCGSLRLSDSNLVCQYCFQRLQLISKRTQACYRLSNLKIYPKYYWNRTNHALVGPQIQQLKASGSYKTIKNLLIPHPYVHIKKKPLIWVPIPSIKNTDVTKTMAHIMAGIYGGQVQDLLTIGDNSKPQKTLKRIERMNRKFYLKDLSFKKDELSEYIFIDDVVTTGFTIIRASLALNIEKPNVVCFAYRLKTSYVN